MCDTIELPDGTIISSFEGEDTCMCGHTQEEILAYAVSKLPRIEYEQKIIIERTVFGWEISIKNGD